MDRLVKIYGERNTGTRAAQRLLRQIPGLAFRLPGRPAPSGPDPALEAAIEGAMTGPWRRLYLHALRDDAAARACATDPWKHAAPVLTPELRAAGAAILILVRDPYSWLVGLARRPYHIKGPQADTLEAFAARPWMTERREGVPAILRSPTELWQIKATASLACLEAARAAGLGARILRFEDLVADPAAAMRATADALGLPPGPLTPLDDNTKQGEAGLATLQAYYAERRWRDRLSAPTVRRVNADLDPATVAALGYETLAPEDFPETLPDAQRRAMAEEMASLRAPAHAEPDRQASLS